jgi:Nucleotidyl transferase AbiEii toxin, Type IV TA system
MNMKPVKNLAASVHQRLLDKARQTDRPFNELLQYFAIERFLHRLSQSKYAKNFVLKGALMLNVWEGSSLPRATLDIDVLGQQISNEIEAITRAVQEICEQAVEPDGLAFQPASARGLRIAEETGYQGVRVRFSGSLGNARLRMQLDVGFGDIVIPVDTEMPYPTILDFPAPQVRGYSRESTIAEKFEAAVRLGNMNSRMKDFFDIWFLSRQFTFDGPTLAIAIRETFSRRGTTLSSQPLPLTSNFATGTDHAIQWRAFRKRNRLETSPDNFADLMVAVAIFLSPAVTAISENSPFRGSWSPPGPWWTGR